MLAVVDDRAVGDAFALLGAQQVRPDQDQVRRQRGRVVGQLDAVIELFQAVKHALDQLLQRRRVHHARRLRDHRAYGARHVPGRRYNGGERS